LGRKVNPIGFRLGIIKEHKSRWFATGKQYTDQLGEDRQIRSLVFEALNKDDGRSSGRDRGQSTKNKAGISNIDIERQPNQVHIIIDTARPGVIIGRKGASVNLLRQQLQDMTQKKVKIDVREIAKPELGCPPGGGECRRADRAARQLEARYEAGCAEDDALGRSRHHDHGLGAVGRQRHGPRRLCA
jgi:ribosomal protein S3